MKMALERRGLTSWSALREQLCEAEGDCAWSDFSGFRLAPAHTLPTSIPATTHLWAWDATRAVRARIDVDRILVATLHTTPPSEPATGPVEYVQVQIRTGHPWSAADPPIGRADQPLPGREFTLLELPGPSPAVFVRQQAPRS